MVREVGIIIRISGTQAWSGICRRRHEPTSLSNSRHLPTTLLPLSCARDASTNTVHLDSGLLARSKLTPRRIHKERQVNSFQLLILWRVRLPEDLINYTSRFLVGLVDESKMLGTQVNLLGLCQAWSTGKKFQIYVDASWMNSKVIN